MLARFVAWIIGWGLLVPAAVGRDPLDALDGLQVQELFQWLSRHSVDPEAFSQDALNRAALLGLLQDGRTGAVVLSKAEVAPAAAQLPPLMARLGERAAYLRPSPLDPEALKPVAAFLSGLPPEVDTLILELRVPGPPAPLAGALELSSLFLPDQTPLFLLQKNATPDPTVQQTHGPPVWNRRVWLLVDEGTPPVLELTAHLLVRHIDAQVFGSSTRGVMNETTDHPLGPEHVLRLPSTTVSWPDGQRLTGTPLIPTTTVAPVPSSRAALLALTDSAALAAHLIETDRPRLNEAALMVGANPEFAIKSAAPILRPDPLLQQAYDLLITSAFLHLDAAVEIKRAEPGAPKK